MATTTATTTHRAEVAAVRNYVVVSCPCGWGRQLFTVGQAQQFGIAHELNSAETPADLAAVRERHRAERRAARG